jgi:hypothetical protein
MNARNSKGFGVVERAAAETAALRRLQNDLGNTPLGVREYENTVKGQFNALWLCYSILRSDEIWLPEWSGTLGGVQQWRSSVAWGDFGQASLSACAKVNH